jgi:hypothetical protein
MTARYYPHPPNTHISSSPSKSSSPVPVGAADNNNDTLTDVVISSNENNNTNHSSSEEPHSGSPHSVSQGPPSHGYNVDLWVVSVILALSEAARGVVIPVLSTLVTNV